MGTPFDAGARADLEEKTLPVEKDEAHHSSASGAKAMTERKRIGVLTSS